MQENMQFSLVHCTGIYNKIHREIITINDSRSEILKLKYKTYIHTGSGMTLNILWYIVFVKHHARELN